MSKLLQSHVLFRTIANPKVSYYECGQFTSQYKFTIHRDLYSKPQELTCSYNLNTYFVLCILHIQHILPTNAHKTYTLLKCYLTTPICRGYKTTFCVFYILIIYVLCAFVGNICCVCCDQFKSFIYSETTQMVRTLQILCISTTCFGPLLAIIRKVYITHKI